MRTTRPWRLVILAIPPFLVSTAWGQASRGPYYHRTTTPGFVAPRGADRVAPPSPQADDPTAPATPGGWDRLRPYTAGGAGATAGARLGSAYSTHRRAVPPPPRPAPPSARNYYPTARFGQGPNLNVPVQRDQCTPSRGGMIVGSW